MRRNLSLIAAGVTAFTLVILASVAYAYTVMAASRQQPVPLAASQVVAGLPSVPSTLQQPQISPREAANLASTSLGGQDPYSVELAEWNGVPAYKVAFSSGDVVYVGLDGQILGSVPYTSYVSYGGGGGGHGRGNGSSSVSSDGSEHPDDTEHEVEHEVEHEGSGD